MVVVPRGRDTQIFWDVFKFFFTQECFSEFFVNVLPATHTPLIMAEGSSGYFFDSGYTVPDLL